MVDIIITTVTGTDYATLQNASLDLAFGSDQNDFELSFTDEIDESLFGNGSRMYLDGTEYGGIVDKVTSDIETGMPFLTYAGRTWHGVLEKKILTPDTGQDYLKVSGSVSSVLTALISRVRLGELFTVAPNTTQISYQFDRYVPAYTGIRSMLAANNLKLMMTSNQHSVTISVAPVTDMGTQADSDQLDFTLERDYRPVNHLIGLGKGELRNRAVTHWYADSNGVVSQKQSLTGVDEIAATYDYSNAELAELNENTQKKLKELQSQGSLDIQLRDTEETYYVGDVLTGRDNSTGLTVSATVTKKIVKVGDGLLTVDYEVGDESTSQSLSGSSESSGGGGHSSAQELVIDGDFELGDSSYWTIEYAQGMSINSNPAGSHSGNYRFAGNLKTTNVSVRLMSQPFKVSPGRRLRLSCWFWNDGDIVEATFKIVYNNGESSIIDISSKTDSWVYKYLDVEVPDGASTGYVRIAYYSQGYSVFARLDDVSVKDITDMKVASFLAAYPVGSIYHTTISVNPGDVNGGTWRSLPSQVGYLWERLS